MSAPARIAGRLRVRRGFSLAEVMVSLVIVAILGAALTRLMVDQMRQFDRQIVQRDARAVSRGAVNLMLSELRMVEPVGGITAASSTSITVRVPYAMGIVCARSGATATISLLPVDSVQYAQATFGGFAYRDSAGSYTYVTSGASTGLGSAATCTGASITTLPGGKVITVSPAVPNTVAIGFPVFLFQNVTYEFKASSMVAGRNGIWRAVGGVDEELAAPFDTSARFKFYVLNRDTSQIAVPTLSQIRGVDLLFHGQSERAPQGSTRKVTAKVTTAVFFRNRLD